MRDFRLHFNAAGKFSDVIVTYEEKAISEDISNKQLYGGTGMKKVFVIVLLIGIMIFGLFACGGNVRNVEVEPYESELYTEKDIESAIRVTKRYFMGNFSGCTLTTLSYAGDKASEGHIEWAERHDADEVIVLKSSFDVDASGGDGSLNPNSTYNGWLWILVRDEGGRWRHVDHGY